MTLLPVVARELRVAARRPGSYWGRSLAALVAIGVFAWLFLLERGSSGANLGQVLFAVISSLAYLFAALAGVLFSADSISSERREGTLGLLFLTDLRGLDIALGKLTASSLAAIYGLLAILPVLGLCLLMGGVTGAEYGRVILVLVSVLLTSLALGLLASTLANDPMRAAVTALALILLWQLGGPAAGAVASVVLARFGWETAAINTLFAGWEWVTPITALTGAQADGYRQNAPAFHHALMGCAVLGFGAVAFASFRLPHLWQISAGGTRRSWAGRLKHVRFRSPEDWVRFRTRLLELHPVVWLSGRHWLRNGLVWACLGGAALGYAVLSAISGGDDWWQGGLILALTFLVHAFLKCWAALEAPRQFFGDRRSGALELLLTTPVTVPELVRGRMVALRRQFFGPALAVVAVEVIVGLRLLAEHPNDRDTPVWLLLGFIHITALFFDLWTIGWVGNWLGLSATGGRSTLHVVLRVLLLPWTAFVLGTPLVSFLFAGTNSGSVNWAVVILLAWLALTTANNLFWQARARRGLLGRFRDTASGQLRRAAKSRG